MVHYRNMRRRAIAHVPTKKVTLAIIEGWIIAGVTVLNVCVTRYIAIIAKC